MSVGVKRKDRRAITLTLLVLTVGILGQLLSWWVDGVEQDALPERYPAESPGPASAQPVPDAPIDPGIDPEAHAREAREAEIALRFDQGVSMLHARQYDYALAAWHRVLELAPTLPEAHVNMGFTLLGMEQYTEAYDFFVAAAELKPEQHNAYYGMAQALAGLQQLRQAVEAMEAYIHLEAPGSPFRQSAMKTVQRWREMAARQDQEAREAEMVGDKAQHDNDGAPSDRVPSPLIGTDDN